MATPRWRPGALFTLSTLLTALAFPAQAQYSSQTIPANFVDISGLSGTVAGPTGDDVISATLTFPGGFVFPFYGTNRTQFKMSTNGFLTFQTTHTTGTATNQDFPSATDPDAVVSPLWDDLVVPTTGTLGTTHYYFDNLGTPLDLSDDRVIVQWTNAYFYNDTAKRATFQIQLYADGDIEFHYALLTNPQLDYSIGIENDAGTQAVDIYYGASATVPGTGTQASTANGFRIFIDIPVNPPNCATQVSPTDGATNVPYGSTTLTWTPPASGPPVAGYFLDVGTTSGGGEVISNLDIGSVTSYAVIGLDPNATYYWRVRPYNAVGSASGCSISSFTTAPPVTTFPFVEDFASTTFPPPNWTRFDNGNGTTQSWTRIATTPLYAQSRYENVTTGVAADYLATPALVIPSAGAVLTFKMWQSFGTVYTDAYKVLVSTDDQTQISDYTEIASWGDATPCPGSSTAPPTSAPTDPNCGVSLAAYAGQTIYVAFLHETDDGDNFNLDDVRVTEIPSQPVFAITPSGAQDLGTAGACVAPSERRQVFTISNNGAGTLTVSNVALDAGSSSAFSLASGPSFPVTLTGGQSTTVTVVFAPGVGASGAQTGALLVDYDVGGGSQTFTVNLSGTATDVNLAFGAGAGYLYRNSVNACSSPSIIPDPGTALVPFASDPNHTKITALTSGDFDDGYFDVPAAALDALIGGGSFRMFGKTYESLRITTNGNLAFDLSAAYGAAADRTITLPTTALGGAVIAGAGMDLNLSPTTYASDNLGIGGTPGIWLGASDVDGDGDNELVVTYYHAYEFGSASFPSTSAIYFTFQVILFDSGEPNREDRVEVRFQDGVDANNVPFRLNTAPAIEADVAIGLSNPQGTASAEYRDNAPAPAPPLYGSDLGVRFQAEVQAVVNEPVAGWRMMGAPVKDYTVGRLADLNLVQSVVGQYPEFPADNLRIDYDGIEYVPAADVAQTLVPGQGFMWYLYDQNLTPDPASFGGGTSVSYALPMELEGTGEAVSLTAGAYPIPLHEDGKKWNLIANPFRRSLDLTGLGSWAVDGTLASGVGQIFLPTSANAPFGTYVLTTDPSINNVVTAWQGLLVENEDAAALAVPATAQTDGGSFVGREGAPVVEDVRVIAFQLAAADGGQPLDRAALLYFHPEAEAGWDLWDVSKLAPLSSTYAAIAFGGERDGAPVAKAQESRPADGSTFDVPIQLDAVGIGGALTLSWPSLNNIPEAWSLRLTDLETGAEVDLRQDSSYTFEVGPAAKDQPTGRRIAEGRMAESQGLSAVASLSRGADRFVLHVAGAAVGTEPVQDLPTVFALEGAYPNPSSGATTVRYAVPEEARVTVEVFDLLGRRVATLVDATARPGYHHARWDAADAASGVYVVRMRCDTGFAQSQRVTLLK